MATSGSIGTRRDLRVRVGDTLRPQLLALSLASGQVLDPDGADVVARIYRRETDLTPLVSPTFEIEPLSVIDGMARWLLKLSKQSVAALAALPATADTASAVPYLRPLSDPGQRVFYWACSFHDAGGQSFPLYYGRLTVYLGATPIGGQGGC